MCSVMESNHPRPKPSALQALPLPLRYNTALFQRAFTILLPRQLESNQSLPCFRRAHYHYAITGLIIISLLPMLTQLSDNTLLVLHLYFYPYLIPLTQDILQLPNLIPLYQLLMSIYLYFSFSYLLPQTKKPHHLLMGCKITIQTIT